MNKLAFLFLLAVMSTVNSIAQSIDQNTINQALKTYSSAGDTVGIYAVKDNEKVMMDPINFKGIKTNVLGSALTYGIAKSKMKVEFSGTSSPYQFTGNAHFRLYFGNVPVNKVARYYMFSPSYTIRDFSVAKFIVKKNKRQLVNSTYSLWTGTQTGVKTDEDVKVITKHVRDGVYDVEVEAAPGEYCFVFTTNGVGAFTTVFDFSIVK